MKLNFKALAGLELAGTMKYAVAFLTEDAGMQFVVYETYEEALNQFNYQLELGRKVELWVRASGVYSQN